MFRKRVSRRPSAPQPKFSNRIPRGFDKQALFLWGSIILLSFVVGGVISFLVFFFRIDSIDIQRDQNDKNLQSDKLQMMMKSVYDENLLFLSSSFLQKKLFISFPELSDITIIKKFPRTLILQPITDPLVFKWIYKTINNEDQYFGYVSKKGLYFKHGPEEIFTIFDNDVRLEYIPLMSPLLSPEEIENITNSKSLLEQVTGRKMIKMNYLRHAQEIHFIDDKEVAYWIFLKESSILQIEKLSTAIAEHDIYSSPLEYIDLRISRKVIYKKKEK